MGIQDRFLEEGMPQSQWGTFPLNEGRQEFVRNGDRRNEVEISIRNRGQTIAAPRRRINSGREGQVEVKRTRKEFDAREKRTSTQLISAAKKNVLKTAAVTITKEEGGPSYADILRNAREKNFSRESWYTNNKHQESCQWLLLIIDS